MPSEGGAHTADLFVDVVGPGRPVRFPAKLKGMGVFQTHVGSANLRIFGPAADEPLKFYPPGVAIGHAVAKFVYLQSNFSQTATIPPTTSVSIAESIDKHAFKVVSPNAATNIPPGGRDKVIILFCPYKSGYHLAALRVDVSQLQTAPVGVALLASHTLRVRPETLCRITEFSEHESNGRELDEGERVAVEVLPVLGQSAAAVEPGDGAFDHPTPGLDDEALHPIGSLDDLGLEIGQDAGQGAVKDRPLIGAVGEQFPEKGKQTEQGRQQRETAVAILNVGGGDDAVQQQALRIDQNMPLLALDQLAGIEAVAVDASPPFSALFTL